MKNLEYIITNMLDSAIYNNRMEDELSTISKLLDTEKEKELDYTLSDTEEATYLKKMHIVAIDMLKIDKNDIDLKNDLLKIYNKMFIANPDMMTSELAVNIFLEWSKRIKLK